MDSIVQGPTILDLINILNAILAIISLVLIFIAMKKYNIKKIFGKCLIMYFISLIIIFYNDITLNNMGGAIGIKEPSMLEVLSKLLIPTIIRLIMVIYPIIKIKKVKK